MYEAMKKKCSRPFRLLQTMRFALKDEQIGDETFAGPVSVGVQTHWVQINKKSKHDKSLQWLQHRFQLWLFAAALFFTVCIMHSKLKKEQNPIDGNYENAKTSIENKQQILFSLSINWLKVLCISSFFLFKNYVFYYIFLSIPLISYKMHALKLAEKENHKFFS